MRKGKAWGNTRLFQTIPSKNMGLFFLGFPRNQIPTNTSLAWFFLPVMAQTIRE
jgi:hypothetical protein